MPIEDFPGHTPPGFSPPQYPIPPAYKPEPPVTSPPNVAPTQPPAQMTELPDNMFGFFMLLLGL